MSRRKSFQKEKTKFRATKKWKDFRDRMRDKQDKKDPVTGQKLTRMANLHHKDLDEYLRKDDTDIAIHKLMDLYYRGR